MTSPRLLRFVGLGWTISLLCSCNRVEIPSSIEVWPETERVFSTHGKNFRVSISRAIHGPDSYISDFISERRLVRDTGAGAYGFGVALLDLAREVGDERFLRVVSRLTPEDREQVWSLVTAGAEHGHNRVGDEELHHALPRTMNILDDVKPKRPH